MSRRLKREEMKLTPLGISGAWLAESSVWNDGRGFFREWFKQNEIQKIFGREFTVQQANFSMSNKGVIRGIHFSTASPGQAKLVTCVSGSIVDVIVDIRPNSPTFKKVEYVNLSPETGKSVLVGEGLGHGFISLMNNSGVSYLLSSLYKPELEFGINPFDKDLGVQWGEFLDVKQFIYSDADRDAPSLQNQAKLGRLPKQFE